MNNTSFSSVLNQIILLFILMLIGAYCRKRNILNKESTKGLSELILNVTLPLMIINSFNLSFTSDMFINAGKVLVYSIIIHILFLVITRFTYFRFKKRKQAVLRFMTVFSNTGFMGFPIIKSLMGNVGVFYASIFNIVFNVFVWTFGVMLYTDKKDKNSLKKVLFNPSIISVAIGFMIFILSIELHPIIGSTLKIVGDLTTPISMIIIGTMLAESHLADLFQDISLYYGSFNRLVLMPIITYWVLRLINADEMLIKICVILEAMPSGVMTGIVAEKYGGDYLLASKSVFITTALSIITIPIAVLII